MSTRTFTVLRSAIETVEEKGLNSSCKFKNETTTVPDIGLSQKQHLIF